MADVGEIEVVVAHHERATLRVGDVFLKIDADQTRTDVEVRRWLWRRSRRSGTRSTSASAVVAVGEEVEHAVRGSVAEQGGGRVDRVYPVDPPR